ncbi:MAG: hypothetical protein AAGL10_05780 [Pseudomonadota bacterium]
MPASNDIQPEEIQAFVLGTLDRDEAARIEQAAKSDADLAAEIALCEAARDLQSDAAMASDPGELGWARLDRAIDDKTTGAVPAADNSAANDNAPSWAKRRFAGWQVAASVAMAVIGWHALVVPMIAPQPSEDTRYELASGDDGNTFALRVAFTDTATEADLRIALRGVDARIVDGPSAIGLYTIAFDTEEAMNSASEQLTANSRIIADVTPSAP